MALAVYFKRAAYGDAMDALIAKATRGPFSHCEICFANGGFFSSFYDAGVRWLYRVDNYADGHRMEPPYWEIIQTPWSETPEIRGWCDSLVGKQYDYLGAIASGLGLELGLADHWYCSEIAREVLSRAGAVGIPALPSPNTLYRWLCATLNIVGAADTGLELQWPSPVTWNCVCAAAPEAEAITGGLMPDMGPIYTAMASMDRAMKAMEATAKTGTEKLQALDPTRLNHVLALTEELLARKAKVEGWS